MAVSMQATTALEALDKELMTLVDTFGHMMRAAKVPDKEVEQAGMRDKSRAPGDLLEVWAEKLIYSAHTALHWVGELKSRALVSDLKALTSTARTVRVAFENEDAQVSAQLTIMAQEAHAMLKELEDSYWGTDPSLRGRLGDEGLSAQLTALAQV
mmetsp:Transcript_5974/g.10405  ORF Transcript_5974/g.10405 Transcript_5974/m.10405 type:complete len:155 (-) Transcript_5974:178-642(-)